MRVTKKYRQEVEQELLEVIIEGLEKEKLEVSDLPKIARFLLETVHAAKDRKDLISHLDTLKGKWPIFDHPRIHPHLAG